MAKTIRPLRCPTCGSPNKTTIGPDLFRCTACQTEYYLDTDDVTVTVRHQLPPPVPAPAPRPARALAGAFLLLLAIGAALWLGLRGRGPGAGPTSAIPVMQPIFYLTNYLYADARQQPVYVTLRTEAPRWGSDSLTIYADFFDPRTGQRRHEQVLEPLGHRLDDHTYEWHTFANGQVYLLGHQHLYRLDRRADQLLDVTNTLLANYAPASSGTAQVDFDTSHEALRILTNDGRTFYYLPATGQVFADGDAFYEAAKAAQPRRYFSLEPPDQPGPGDAPYQLLRYPAAGAPPLDLTNGRRFLSRAFCTRPPMRCSSRRPPRPRPTARTSCSGSTRPPAGCYGAGRLAPTIFRRPCAPPTALPCSTAAAPPWTTCTAWCC